MHTLVKVIDQVEESLPAEEGEELEKVVSPECGNFFSQSGYKVTVHAFVAQKPTQEVEEGKETPTMESKGKDEKEVEMIPNPKVREDEKLESQPSGDMELFLDQCDTVDTKLTQE